MTLRKLVAPGVNPGGVDKLYGEDWNRLVDALTGGVAENLTINGTVQHGGNVSIEKATALLNIQTPANTTEPTLRLGQAGATAWDVYLTSPSGDLSFAVNGGQAGLRIVRSGTSVAYVYVPNGDLILKPAKKLYLDDGGDTYLVEGAPNILSVYAGGVEALKIGSGGGGIALNAEKPLYLDSGVNTWIQEAAGGDKIAFVVGGTNTAVIGIGIGMRSGDKLYLDGVGLAGDTYITEGAANRIDFFGGGTRWLMLGYNNGVVIPSTKKLFFDDGGDTYLVESGANVLDVYVGGVQMAQINTTHIDINQKTLRNPKNSANTAVSGTPRTVEIDIGGTPYYFPVYPASSA